MAEKTWKLVNMKIKHEVLARIEGEAHRLGLTRTAYMVQCSDPSAKATARKARA